MADVKLCKICGWQIVQASDATGLWLDADAYDCGDDGHFHEPEVLFPGDTPGHPSIDDDAEYERLRRTDSGFDND